MPIIREELNLFYTGTGIPDFIPGRDRVFYLQTDVNPPVLWVWFSNQWKQIHVYNTENATNADKVDGYHASTIPTPNTIPVADSNGKLDINWLSPIQSGGKGFSNVIDLTNATEDYFLQVGEVAKIVAQDVSSKPLRIATQDGTAYNMWVLPYNTGGTSGGSGNPIYIYPNNTTYSDAFVYMGTQPSQITYIYEMYNEYEWIWRLHTATTSLFAINYITYSAFRIAQAGVIFIAQ